LAFLLNAMLFVLIGLQLRAVVAGLAGWSVASLIGSALAVAGAVVAVRLIWFFTVPYLIRAVDRRESQRRRRVGPRQRFVLAWSGMRGAVSLAAALALPLSTAAGVPFPERDLIIFLTFVVIFVTLVLQGLSLPSVIRRLGVEGGAEDAQEELNARLAATRVALDRIDSLGEQDWTRNDSVERLRGAYEYRHRRLSARAGDIEDDGCYEDRSLAYQQMIQIVITTQREELVRMRNSGEISTDVMNRLIREFDLEESRLEL